MQVARNDGNGIFVGEKGRPNVAKIETRSRGQELRSSLVIKTPSASAKLPIQRVAQGRVVARHDDNFRLWLGLRDKSVFKSAWGLAGRWKGRLSFALLDHGSSSVANLVLTILATRWLPIESFGYYGVVWAISFLIEAIATSLINDPLPAIISQRRQSMRPQLYTAVLSVSLIFGGITSLILIAGAIAALLWSVELGVLLLCLAAANPFQRLQFVVRRLCYMRDRQDIAAVAGVVFAIVLLGGAVVLRAMGQFTAPVIVLLWGLASGATFLVGVASGISRPAAIRRAIVTWLVGRLWHSGRWLIGASLAFWVGNQGILPLVAIFAGPAASGILQALQVLFIPVARFNVAINYAVVPALADLAAGAGARRMRFAGLCGVIAFSLVAVSYSAVVLIAHEGILTLLYHKAEITSAAGLLWPLAAAAILESATQGLVLVLVASAHTRAIFMSRVASVPVFLLGALILGPPMGVEGIMWAVVASRGVIILMDLAGAMGYYILDNGSQMGESVEGQVGALRKNLTNAE